jgi:hypothetical protein
MKIFSIRMDRPTEARIEAIRRGREEIPQVAPLVRELVEIGLKAVEKEMAAKAKLTTA